MLVLALASSAHAAPLVAERGAQREVTLTVYQSDLGLVRDTREVGLGAGVVSVLEQRYAAGLLTPETLLARFIGREVELRMHGRLVRARLLGTTGGPVYELDGKVYVNPDATPVLPFLPEDLVARPTLAWRLRSREAGRRWLEAAYLTSGLSWQAVYTLVLDRDATRDDLTGWASVTNRSGVAYRDATLALVAGDVNRAPRGPIPVGMARERGAMAGPRSPTTRRPRSGSSRRRGSP